MATVETDRSLGGGHRRHGFRACRRTEPDAPRCPLPLRRDCRLAPGSRRYSRLVDGVQRHEGRNILVRTVAPGVALFVLIVVLGLLITPPGLAIATGEESVSRRLEAARTDTWNVVT